MIDRDLLKHAREFIRALTNFKFERTGDARGIYVPHARAFISGTHYHDVNGQDLQADPNLLPDEGLRYLLTAGLLNGSKIGIWYLAPYAANYTPLAGLTAASFPATAAEITSGAEGYTQSSRPAWAPGAVDSSNLVSNLLNKADITIATASTLTISGVALLSESAKGAITGTLVSATKYANARTLYNTDVFGLAYKVQLTSV